MNRTPLGLLANENDFQNVKYYPISSTYIIPYQESQKTYRFRLVIHTLRRLHPV